MLLATKREYQNEETGQSKIPFFYGEREGGEGKEKPFNLTNRRFIRYLWVKSWEKAESDHTSLK